MCPEGKFIMRNISWVSALCFLVVFSGCLAFGQAPSTHSPGERYAIAITFEGIDAQKVVGGRAAFTLQGEKHPDQAFYVSTLDLSESKLDGTNTVVLSTTISPSMASGVYKLNVIDLYNSANVGDEYRPPEFPEFKMEIKNPDHFEKPAIKSVKEHP